MKDCKAYKKNFPPLVLCLVVAGRLACPRAMMAGAYAPDMLNYARLLYGQRARLNSTLVLQAGAPH